MATQNITIDQNADTNVNITEATADPADKIIMAFYENGINIFNLATEGQGGAAGEVTIVEDTRYTMAVTAELALRLNPSDTITHKVFRLDANDKPTTLHTGSVTVTPLIGADLVATGLSYNNDRMYERIATGLADTLTKDDQVVYYDRAGGVAVSVPDATTMPGKEFTLINEGAGDVTIILDSGTLTLNTGEMAWIRAKAHAAEVDDYQILYTTGALA